jgi:ABC-2 type transport system permease protein
MTLIVPVLLLLAIGLVQLVSAIIEPGEVETTTIGYVDEIGGFEGFTAQGPVELVSYPTQAEATAALLADDVSEYFVISTSYTSTGLINRYTLEKQLEPPPGIQGAIKVFLTSNLLSGEVPQETIQLVESPLYLSTTRLDETGAVATEQGGFGNLILPGIFSLLLALGLNFYAAYMVQGLGEEKESRLIEVLLSSVTTRQLLVGKVLGLGVAGLVQVAVWLVSLPLLLNLASSTLGGFFSTMQVPPNFILLGIIYFILGYLLFAALSAGVGAISPSAREGMQLSPIYSMFAIVPLWFSSLLMIFPNSPIWTVLTIFPITAPVEVMLRLGVSDIPTWELAVSIVVLALSIVGVLFVSIRVFRVYLLMYGKRPGLGEVIRNLRSG